MLILIIRRNNIRKVTLKNQNLWSMRFGMLKWLQKIKIYLFEVMIYFFKLQLILIPNLNLHTILTKSKLFFTKNFKPFQRYLSERALI